MKKQSVQNNPMAIIGMGCIFSQSRDVKAFLRLLLKGGNAVTEPPDTHAQLNDFFDPDPRRPDHIYCKRGGYLPKIDFDPTEFGIPPHALEATDTSQLLGLLTAKAALADAGYGDGKKAFDREKVSIILGVTGTQEMVIPLGARLGHPIWRRALAESGVNGDQAQAVVKRISAAYVDWQENSFPGLLGNVVAGRIANRLDLGGTNCVVDAACASSMGAIHMAAMELAARRSDMVITGGVDTINDAFMHMCFAKSHILSPTGDIRPFSRDADGTVLGEGIGLLVLKRLADAERDGDRIYALIRGIGSASDGKSSSIYAPRAEGQVRALQRAYQDADIDPLSVDMVEAHGTGTRVGDQVEFKALREIFGASAPHRRSCALGSVKSNIGHTKATAGTAGLIKTALALYHKVLPPTLKAEPVDPKLDLDHSPFYLNTRLRPWTSSARRPRRAGVSAFGFGGSNFHAVLEEYDPRKHLPSWDASVEIAAFSADDRSLLAQKIDQGLMVLDASTDGYDHIARLAYHSRQVFDFRHTCRIVVVLDDLSDHVKMRSRMAAARSCVVTGSVPDSENVEHIAFGQGPATGSLAFLFPGQGSQYVDMGRDVICTFPASLAVLQDAVIHCDIAQLDEAIFPRIGKHGADSAETLRRTDIAQPAIGAISMAMLKALEFFNVRPEAACGHSYGELTALCAAGWLTQEAFWALSAARGSAMAEAGAAAEEPGVMSAVEAPPVELDELVQRVKARPLVVANRNSPRQGVLSGSLRAVTEAEEVCRHKGWKVVRLPVAAAFHSPLVAEARRVFAKTLKNSGLRVGTLPVMSNTTGGAYPSDRSEALQTLAAQLASPVDFKANIETLYTSGVRTFIEVGPRNILTRLVGDILDKRPHFATAVDRSCGRRNGLVDLAGVLARIAAAGHAVSIERWESEPPPERRARMTVSLSGANYRPTPLPGQAPRSILSAPSSQTPVRNPIQTMTTLSANHRSPETVRSTSVTKEEHPVSKNDPGQPVQKAIVQSALAALQHGMTALQALQSQTAQAHQKFLEAQTEASRTLRQMMHNAQQWSAVTGTMAASPSAFETAPFPATQIMNQPDSFAVETPVTSTPVMPVQRSAAEPARVIPAPWVSDQNHPVRNTLIDIVSRLTGYPTEMLGLEMDIESDLGIDSIKRVEILSALEEQLPDLPKVTPEMMGTLKTLGQICAYLSGGSAPELLPAQGPPPAVAVVTSDQPHAVVHTALVGIVSRLTGYPTEMLGLEMDIESDLGIDSIKRVEILSALEEQLPDLPKVTPEMMGTLKTLGQICAYLSGGSAPELLPAQGPPPAVAVVTSDQPHAVVHTALIGIVSRLTGYPTEMLGLEMDIESDLGIDSIKRVEILSALEEQLPDLPKVTPEMMGTLKTLGQICAYLTGGSAILISADPPASSVAEPRLERYLIRVVPAPAPPEREWKLPKGHYVGVVSGRPDVGNEIIEWLGHRSIESRALAHVDDMSRDKRMAGLILIAPLPPLQAFEWARAAAPLLNTAAGHGGAFFAAVSFLDGAFGFEAKRLIDPMQGALAGLVKTAALEWPEVSCRAIDIDPNWHDAAARIEALCDTILTYGAETPVEIGLSAARRVVLALAADAGKVHDDLRLDEKDVVVVSGGARGVTAAACSALAGATGCRLALIGRSPAPSAEPQWLENLSDDEGVLKKAILEHRFASRATPKELEGAFRRVMANRRIRRTLAELANKGSQTRYFSADVCDAAALEGVFDCIRAEFGPIRALIHGAGISEDRLIVDKQPEQFARVFDTKVVGLQNMLHAAAQDDLRYLLLFSSVSARMGNSGQADYAMANEVLNKMARMLAAERPGCKVAALNWGPWDGGMVTPALRRNFQKQGVDLIPMPLGAAAFVAEMKQPVDGPVEVVLGGPLKAQPIRPPDTPLLFEPAGTFLAQAVRREIDVARYPVLESHCLDGRPVVPLALITEWLAHGALHANPGMTLHGMDNLRLLKGISLEEGCKTIRMMAGKAQRKGQLFEVEVEIRDGVKNGREVVHSQAKAILTDHFPPAPLFEENGHFKGKGLSRSVDEIYEGILFHGHHLRGIRKIIAISEKGLSAQVAAAPAPHKWITEPFRSRWIADPLILDCAFQMAIIWCHEQKGMRSLPSFAAAYRQYRDRFPEQVTSVLEVERATDRKLIGNYYFLDENKQVVAELKGYEAIMDPALERAFHGKIAAAN
jgi:acyl transferase domain-containing protein/NAD(P)-dependent dehydrogenase (short-subunit alcohol dehydrogenase family)